MEEYMEKNFIGTARVVRGRVARRPPRFAHAEWNQVTATNLGAVRTNNRLEGWNNSFNAYLGRTKPSFYTFLLKLHGELASSRHDWLTYKDGGAPKKQKAKYCALNARLSNLVTSYNPTSILHYLRSITHVNQF
jgi:hypothetical protein